MRVGWYSAYYRGLATLAKMWPSILKECPEAKLDVAYGWGSWDAIEGVNGQALKEELETFFEEYKDSVTHHGRLSHEALAKLMKKTHVFAYTSEFPEISMITMMKVLAAGCYPISTGVGAVSETQGPFGKIIKTSNLASNEYAQKKFIKEIVRVLRNPLTEAEKKQQYDWVVDKYSWEVVAKQWHELLT